MNSYVSEGGRNTTVSRKNGHGAFWHRKQMTCESVRFFLLVSKNALADDMRIVFFFFSGIRFTTFMSCEHSVGFLIFY